MNKIIVGDCRDVMRGLIADGVKVQMCVTSPPYWRQRDYGMPGQLGLETTPEEYTDHMVSVFRLVRDLLADDGILWLNLGDKWASGGNGGGGSFMQDRAEAWSHAKHSKGWRSPPNGYKDKDLVGIPWMTAFALRADGWYLPQCNIWAKKNGMSESVTDRSTIAHEYVFQLTKNNDYYYNAEAARTPLAPSSETRLAQNVENQAGSVRDNGGTKTNGPMKAVSKKGNPRSVAASAHGIDERKHARYDSANLRSVWWLATANSGDGHFAVMPSELAEICVVSGSRPGDVVLDPFFGSGTTGEVAQRLGRNWLGIELNEEYVKLAEKRTSGTIGMQFAEALP